MREDTFEYLYTRCTRSLVAQYVIHYCNEHGYSVLCVISSTVWTIIIVVLNIIHCFVPPPPSSHTEYGTKSGTTFHFHTQANHSLHLTLCIFVTDEAYVAPMCHFCLPFPLSLANIVWGTCTACTVSFRARFFSSFANTLFKCVPTSFLCHIYQP